MSEPIAFAPQTGLAQGPLGAAQEADRAMGRAFVARVQALIELAGRRPASADRAQGEPGTMSPGRWQARPEVLLPVSEWAAQEVSIGLVCSRRKAEDVIEQALTLQRLPGVLAAVDSGLLTLGHVWAFEEHVAPIADEAVRAEIEAEVLRWVAARAARRTITTPPQLRYKVLREVTRRNARDRAQEAIKALRKRGVFRQAESGEGLAAIGLVGTVPEIEALHAALSAYVDALPKARRCADAGAEDARRAAGPGVAPRVRRTRSGAGGAHARGRGADAAGWGRPRRAERAGGLGRDGPPAAERADRSRSRRGDGRRAAAPRRLRGPRRRRPGSRGHRVRGPRPVHTGGAGADRAVGVVRRAAVADRRR